MEDVERNGHCFTDGAGTLSPQLLRAALVKMGRVDDVGTVSAIQVCVGSKFRIQKLGSVVAVSVT